MAVKFLDSITVDGDVGIGTASPATKLHVSNGDIRIDNSKQLQFGSGGVRINNDASGRMYQKAPLDFYWETQGYTMVLRQSGNLGIGTTSPGAKLQVVGTSGTTQSIIGYGTQNLYVGVSGTNVDLKSSGSSAGTFTFSTGNTERVRITANAGNVGIGISSPAAKLDVLQEARISYAAGNQYRVRVTNTDGNGRILVDGEESALIFGTSAATANATATEKMRISSEGNVGIGTTVPKDKLHVEGHLRVASTSPIIKLDETDTFNGNWAIINSGSVMTFRTANSAFSSYNTKISINQNGSIEFNSYNASATATGVTAINPNQSFYPSGTRSDTTTDLAVDQSGNVVRTTQEATWKLTRSQVNAITTSAAGTTLLSAPGSSNLFIIIEKVTFLIQFAYNGNQMAANQQYEILQDGNVADQIAVLNGNRVNDIAYRGGNTNTSGIYEHDTGYATLNRTYKPNTATTIRRANTSALNTAITTMSIKMRYRVYDTATF